MATTKDRISEEEVKTFLDRFVDLYEKGDKGFFDLFAPNATVFAISSPTRIEGRDQFQKGFAPHFDPKSKRVSQILSPDIQVFGDTALVSYHNRIQAGGTTHDLQGSLVLRRNQRGGLNVTHLHNSPQSTASSFSVGVGRSIEDFAILEERVATAISAVGTPK